jgi:hypothetical protein
MFTMRIAAVVLAVMATACEKQEAPSVDTRPAQKPAEKSATKAPEQPAVKAQEKTVEAAFKTAAIEFTAKDKTAVAQKALGADAGKLSSFTEYKFTGNGVILMVAAFTDPNDVPRLGDTLSESVKAQAKAVPGLEYSSVGGMKDKRLAAYVLSPSSDSAAKTKVLSQISQ